MTSPPTSTEHQLRWAADQVRGWRRWIATARPVHPGSSLAVDDKILRVLPPSRLAYHGIAHALDHLDLLVTAVERSAGSTAALAPQTLAHSGALGAARALWVVDGPGRVQRMRRALALAHDEFEHERAALQEVGTLPRAAPGLAQEIDLRTRWMADAVRAGLRIGITAGEVATPVDPSSIVDDVVGRYVEDGPAGARDLVAAYRIVWRTHRATGRGRRWPTTVAVTTGAGPAGGFGSRVGAGGHEGLIRSAVAVALLLDRAIGLYERRRHGHP